MKDICGIRIKTCPCCGAKFVFHDESVWKTKGKTYCSYTCWRANGGGELKKGGKNNVV